MRGRDNTLYITVDDVRSMLNGEAEETLCKAFLEDRVLTINEAMDCFSAEDIEGWLKDNAEMYEYYKKQEL